MLKIDHPQIYIYSYQLSRESKTEVKSIWTWANNIWQHFSPEKEVIFSQANLSYPLTKVKKFSHSNKIDGSFRFCLLDDSQGILARIGTPETDENKDIDIAALKDFNVNNLMADSYEDWLGQTIFITYKLPTYQPRTNKKYLRQIADECLKNLFPEASVHPPFYRDTELLGSPIFEYSSLKSQLQVFVYLVDGEIEEKLGQILQPLFELFYYRHKITTAFLDSRKIYDLLKGLYAKIEGIIASLETKIPQFESNNDVASQENVNTDESLTSLKIILKQLLRENLDYQRKLEFLENSNNTINIHDYNYQEKLAQICDKWQASTEDLTTFKFFIDKNSPYLQRQIQGDLGYFKHGTDLIKIAVDLVAGIVDIEQAEIDRSLERTIQILGTGLGAGGIVVSAVANYVERDIVFRIPQNGDRIHPAVASLLWSLLAVIVVSGFVGWINGAWKINKYRWFRRKSEPRRLPDSQSPPVNDMLQEAAEVRSPAEQE
jgi:hypothetical protein